LIYLSAMAGVIHFIWLVKADLRRPLTYGAILAGLLLFRVGLWVIGSPGHRFIGSSEKPKPNLAAN
jgi:DMSO/TMAO reductase YedYZ heme-binding membrane subunit